MPPVPRFPTCARGAFLLIFLLLSTACATRIAATPGTMPPRFELPRLKDEAFAVAFDPSGEHLYTGHRSGRICEWDLETRKLSRDFLGHKDNIQRLAVTPDGRALLSAAGAWSISPAEPSFVLWAIDTGGELAHHSVTLAEFAALALSPDGQYVAVAERADPPNHEYNAVLIIREFRTWKTIQSLPLMFYADDVLFWTDHLAPGRQVACTRRVSLAVDGQPVVRSANDLIAISPDGRHIWSDERPVYDPILAMAEILHPIRGPRLIEHQRGQPPRRWALDRPYGDLGQFRHLVPLSDNRRLILALECDIYLIDTITKQDRRLHEGNVSTHAIALSPDGRRAAACGVWGVAVWDVPSSEPLPK